VILHDVGWDDYESALAIRGESSAVRIAYLEGVLEIHRRLGVREMWVWERNEIAVFALRGDRYQRVDRSELLPQIDLGLIQTLLDSPSQSAAVRELRGRLRST
jgi:hypothetical protein